MSNNYEYAYDEPFGWYDGIGFSTNENDFGEAITSAIPLYTHPALSQEREPVATLRITEQCEYSLWLSYETEEEYDRRTKEIGVGEHKLYTHPAQPLSDDEIERIACKDEFWFEEGYGRLKFSYTKFARAIEKAHGIGD